MAFQTTVNREQAMGVVGELFDTSIRRVTPYALAADSTIGGAAWLTNDGKATGTYNFDTASKFIGIFVNPKEYTNFGGNIATPSLVMKASTIGQVADVGRVIVLVSGETKVGQDVYVLVAKGSDITAELGIMKGADSNPSTGSSTTLQTWKKVGKCVRVGANGANQTIVLQIEVA